tara:strand:- start:6170 stop:6739 length:570 start_codon:yes stop_codon:yes gene_type:complete
VSESRRTANDVSVRPEGAPSLPALYERHRDELAAFARGRVGNGPPEPDDLVQQAFANFAGVQNPGNVRNPRAFLFRIVSNLIADHYRREPALPRLDIHDEQHEALFEDGEHRQPEIILLDRERFSEVATAIRALPQRQRRFLLLNRLEGMPYTEIARRNGVSHMTAKREVDAAIRACQRALSDQEPGDE